MARVADQFSIETRRGLLFAAAYALCAFASLAFTLNTAGIAYIWPASGIAMAAMLLLERQGRQVAIAGIAIASFASNYVFGSSFVASAGFTLANVTEAVVAALIVGRTPGEAIRLDSASRMGRLGAASVIAAMVSGAVATPFAHDIARSAFFASWSSTVMLGMLVIGPLTIALVQTVQKRRRTGKNAAALRKPIALVIAASIGVSLATFSTDEMPLLFLPLIIIVYATILLGMQGAMTSLAIVAIVGSWFTSQGTGPVQMVEGAGWFVYFFQFYLLALLACALPVGVIVSDRKRQESELRDNRDLLQSAATLSAMGHWRFEPDTGRVIWSDEFRELFAVPDGADLRSRDVLSAVHPADAPRVRDILQKALFSHETFAFEARIVAQDGKLKHVATRGKVDMDGDRVSAMFGIVVDISERVILTQKLHRARARAEKKAREAQTAAETDALTGVANRRKAMAVLENAGALAEAGGKGFSIILIDADNFKAINDTHGHDAGDRVLKKIAQVGQACLRPTDTFARYGGEEFLAILPGADGQHVHRVAERLRRSVSETRFDLDGHDVTISLGIATWQQGSDSTHLLQAADMALYQAKDAGRNRLRIAV